MELLSLEFILFVLISIIMMSILPKKGRLIFIGLVSLGFYIFYVQLGVLIPLMSLFVTYWAARFVGVSNSQRVKSLILVLGISVNLCLILFNKTLIQIISSTLFSKFHQLINKIVFLQQDNSFYTQVISIAGVSYVVFQAIGYLVDIYREEYEAEKRILNLFIFLFYFPKLISGPIETFYSFKMQFNSFGYLNEENCRLGFSRILYGLFLKLVVADRLILLIGPSFQNPNDFSSFTILFSVLLSGIHLYSDFAGYTYIVRGISKFFGVELTENFNHPFFSETITEFWRNWHISLSNWFRNYFFTPVSYGFRYFGKLGLIFSLMSTFVLIGLWHGFSLGFFLFGLSHGLIISLESLRKKQNIKIRSTSLIWLRNWKRLYVFVLFNITMIFFYGQSSESILSIFNKILSVRTLSFEGNPTDLIYAILAVMLLFLLEVKQKYQLWPYFSLNTTNFFTRHVGYLVLVLIILFFGSFNGAGFVYVEF